MAEWIECRFNKGEIDRAGRSLVPWWMNYEGRSVGHEYLVVENWRTSHSFPLNTFQVGLRTRARPLASSCFVCL
jgi:hypothetical protein